MKQLALLITVLLLSVTFVGCKNKSNNQSGETAGGKLLEQIDGLTTIEHNKHNQIVKVSVRRNDEQDCDQVITYVNDKRIKLNEKHIMKSKAKDDSEINFAINGNVITLTGQQLGTMTINEQGYITKEEITDKNGKILQVITYEYIDGILDSIINQVRFEDDDELYPVYTRNLSFISTKSPFYSDKTPRWLLQHLFDTNGLSYNQSYESNNVSGFENDYEYDSDGYVTRKITFGSDGGEDWYNISRYKYKGEEYASEVISQGELVEMAQRAYDLQVQLDRSKTKDPTITEELRKISERVKTLPKMDQQIYGIESESFFKGYDPDDDSDSGSDLQYTHVAEFDNQTIPITVFRVPISYYDFDGFSIYSLEFVYDGNRQAINILDKEWKIEVEGFLSDITIDDFNFDNCMDVGILRSGGSYNQFYEVFLYDPKAKRYIHNRELSELSDVRGDEKKQKVISYMKGGHAGAIYNAGEYQWKNGKLVQTLSIVQDYDEVTEKYVCTTKTLQNDGTWSEIKESSTWDELYQ